MRTVTLVVVAMLVGCGGSDADPCAPITYEARADGVNPTDLPPELRVLNHMGDAVAVDGVTLLERQTVGADGLISCRLYADLERFERCSGYPAHTLAGTVTKTDRATGADYQAERCIVTQLTREQAEAEIERGWYYFEYDGDPDGPRQMMIYGGPYDSTLHLPGPSVVECEPTAPECA